MRKLSAPSTFLCLLFGALLFVAWTSNRGEGQVAELGAAKDRDQIEKIFHASPLAGNGKKPLLCRYYSKPAWRFNRKTYAIDFIEHEALVRFDEKGTVLTNRVFTRRVKHWNLLPLQAAGDKGNKKKVNRL